MGIDDISSLQRMNQAYVKSASYKPIVEPAANQINGKKKSNQTALVIKPDQVSISPLGRELSKVRKAVSDASVVREDKVAALREAISNGQYKINDLELARNMLNYFLG